MPTVSSLQIATDRRAASSDANDKTLVIRNDPASPLPIGTHRFALVVTDNTGNTSAQAFAEVVILDTQAPTALVAPVTQNVAFGSDFTLDGSDSTDLGGGTIVRYEWTLL